MRATYDERADTLTIGLKEGVEIVESDEDKAGFILDFDAHDDLVSLEVLDASRRVSKPDRVELEATR